MSVRHSLVLWLIAALPSITPAADPLTPVGVAKIDITPTHAVRLSGYGGRRAESDGVQQRIWAKALAIGKDADAILILTVDSLGVPDKIVTDLAERLNRSHGLKRER